MATPNRDKILDALKRQPCTLSDLRPLANSRKAAIMAIYRLREAGHEIEGIPPKSAQGEYTYKLRKLAGSLAPYRFPRG